MKKREKQHDNWATPKAFYEALSEEFGGFTFDPCPLAIAPSIDGTVMDWGERTFVNPPYSRMPKERFIRKAVEEMRKGKLVVMLLPVSTSTAIFHDVVVPNATEIRFLRGRLRFEGYNSKGEFVTNSNGMHDSMVVVFDGRRDV